MSNLTEEERRRIGALRNAVYAGSMDKVAPARTDIALLAKRLDELELEEHSCAEELVKWLRGRVAEDLQTQQGWLADCIEQARIAELQVMEAQRSLAAIDALLSGDMWAANQEVLDRWADVEGDMIERGTLPMPGVTVAAEPEPPTLEPEPEPVTVAAQPEPEPVAVATHAPAPVTDPLAERIMTMLQPMNEAHGQELDAAKVAEFLDEPASRVRAALHVLSNAGRLQYVRRLDRSQSIVLPLGEELDAPTLTEKQRAAFDALVKIADADWKATASRARIRELSGLNQGSLDSHLYILERKGYIATVVRGDSRTPACFLIAEDHRPSREAAPKTDAELIEEALKAGKVTVCPPAFAAPTNVH